LRTKWLAIRNRERLSDNPRFIMHAETTQRQHYNRIAADYEAQYGDPDGVIYRDEFLYGPLLDGLDLEGRSVLEGLSGSGHATEYLLTRKRALVTGLDISEEAIASFKERWPDCHAICAPINASGLADESFDCIVVVMGLHHLHPYLTEALREIHRLLRPGGVFCFTEPHQGSAFSRLRAIWYRHDSLFADNEESLHIEALKREFANLFEFKTEKYVGSVAYLLVLNSMIFRVPLWLKRIYSPAMMRLEKMLARFHSPTFSLAVICQWQKK
jgi:SAM-dependent methyltransferase